MNDLWNGIGSLIGKLTTYIPGRIERLKNEQEKLRDERKKIMDRPASATSINRVCWIDARLSSINTTLANSAKD